MGHTRPQVRRRKLYSIVNKEEGMRIATIAGTVLAVTSVFFSPAVAQEIEFPERDTQQRLLQLSYLGTSGWVGGIAYAKSRGKTAQDLGEWLGDLYAPGWTGRKEDPEVLIRGVRRNFTSFEGSVLQVDREPDGTVILKTNRPHIGQYFGDDHQALGVTVEEYETMNLATNTAIANHLRLDYQRTKVEGDWIEATIAQPPGIVRRIIFPDRNIEQRHLRASWLSISGMVARIAYAKSLGQTAQDLGRFLGSLYAPSWTGPKGQPAGLILGMHRNINAFVGGMVQVVEASDTTIRAKSTRPYVAAYFGDDLAAFGVTVAEYESMFEELNKAIANHLELDYEVEKIEGDWIEFTVSK